VDEVVDPILCGELPLVDDLAACDTSDEASGGLLRR
jgi:hypothetical protein